MTSKESHHGLQVDRFGVEFLSVFMFRCLVGFSVRLVFEVSRTTIASTSSLSSQRSEQTASTNRFTWQNFL